MEIEYPLYLYMDNGIRTTFGNIRELLAAIPLIQRLNKEGKSIIIRDTDNFVIFEAKNGKILHPLPHGVTK